MSSTGRLFREFMGVPADAGGSPRSLPMPHRMVLVAGQPVCACGATLPWQDHATDRQSPSFFRWAWCAPCLRGYLHAEDAGGYETFVRATAPAFDDEIG